MDGTVPVDLDTASAGRPGNHVSVLRTIVGRQSDGGTRGVRALGASGSLLVGLSPAVVTGKVLPIIGQSTMEVWTPSTRRVISDGSVTRIGPPSQAYAAHLCGSPPVWMETHSVELERADWRAWAFLPHSTKPTLLGSSDELVPHENPPPPADEEHLAASATMAYWPITMPGGDGWDAAIAGTRLSRPGARVVVTGGLYPQIARDDALLYVREPRVDGTMAARRFEIRRHDDDKDSLVAAGAMAPKATLEAFVADDDRYAVVVGDPPRGAVGLVDSATMAVWGKGIDGVVRIRLHDSAADLSMSGDLLAWGNGSGNYDGGQYVLDLSDRLLYKVHSNKGGSYIRTCDGYVGWTDFSHGTANRAADFVLARWQ
jgi:hypothetical protein